MEIDEAEIIKEMMREMDIFHSIVKQENRNSPGRLLVRRMAEIMEIHGYCQYCGRYCFLDDRSSDDDVSMI
jgi:hypothetical protein